MSRKNSKASAQKQRGRVPRDLPVPNAKNGKDAKGGASGSIQVLLSDGSARTLAGDGSVLVGMGDGSVRTIGH